MTDNVALEHDTAVAQFETGMAKSHSEIAHFIATLTANELFHTEILRV